MSNCISYMPILRAKQAEFDSLGLLAQNDRALITPLLDIIPAAMMVKKQVNVLEGLAKLAHNIQQNWQSYPICIDIRHLGALAPGLTGSLLMRLCSTLGGPMQSLIPEWRTPIVPAAGLARDAEYESTVRTIVANERAGLCLRLTDRDVRRITLQADIDSFLNRLACVPNDIYLVVDLKYIDEEQVLSVADITTRLPYLMQWKSVVIAAGSFPEDLGSIEVGEKLIPRHEWRAWHSQVTGNQRPPRYVGFGDYGIYHPRHKEQDAWPPSLSIRYASTDHWLIMRGRKARKGGPGYEQYLQHALALCECEEYLSCGPDFSAGDALIAQKAAAYGSGNLSGPGNATTWLAVGFNHHMALTGRNVAAVREAFAEGDSALAA